MPHLEFALITDRLKPCKRLKMAFCLRDVTQCPRLQLVSVMDCTEPKC